MALTNTLLDDLLATPVNAIIYDIENHIDGAFKQGIVTAQHHRYFLFVIALILLFYVAAGFLWFRNAWAKLEDANRALVEEAAARKLMEDKARQHQAELVHVARIATLGEMVSYIAHEVNQPLCAALAYSRAVLHRMRSDPGANQEIVDALEQSALQTQRASDFVQHLRTVIDKNTDYREAGDINQLIRMVTTFIEPDATRKNIEIHLTLDNSLPDVNMERIHIEQVLLNLYRNSIEAIASPAP